MLAPVRVCFVCLGNICRSPTAEAVMSQLVDEAGLRGAIEVDSAGTGGWHVGDPPDQRAVAEAHRRGIAMTSRARKFHQRDLDGFDLVVAMDRSNQRDLHELARTADHHGKIVLLRSFDPASDEPDVPDPYYGGSGGFTEVFDLVDAACRGLLEQLKVQIDGEQIDGERRDGRDADR